MQLIVSFFVTDNNQNISKPIQTILKELEGNVKKLVGKTCSLLAMQFGSCGETRK